MPRLTERLARSSVNILVILIAVVIFVAALAVLLGIASANRPATLQVLAAARDLNFGDPIRSADLVTLTVYQDSLSGTYVPADQAGQVVGGYAALPIPAGQPISRRAVLASAGGSTRLSALLSQYPGYSLFPLPLDAPNVVAAAADSYLPGDLVSVTIVLASRPQAAVTPTPGLASLDTTLTPTPVPGAGAPDPLEQALDRGYPPLAKNLFPQGVRVMAVQGLPAATAPQPGAAGADQPVEVTASDPTRRLILLVPSRSVEPLAYALTGGDRLIVTMVGAGQADSTAGFSYWDLEELFRLEREKNLKATP